MPVSAGHERVAGGEPVYKPMLQKIIERPIDGDRRRAPSIGGRQLFDHIICPQRPCRSAEQIKDGLAPRRQVQPFHMGAVASTTGVVLMLVAFMPLVLWGRFAAFAVNDVHVVIIERARRAGQCDERPARFWLRPV